MVEFRRIELRLLDFNTGQIPGLPANPRAWTDAEIKKIAKSMKNTPELAEARGCIVVPYKGRYVVLGGNLRLSGAKYLKWRDIMCAVLPEDTKPAKLREVVLKDNSSFGSWDLSMLRAEWSDVDFGDWGINVTWDTAGPVPDASVNNTPQEEIERMQKEFDERMARGEISEEDEEYQEFLEKFKLKKTTDDCYTPAPVYDAVARYVEETYGLSRENFVRPFYPGGDYQREKYPEGCVVVDNPPFSFMSEILRFYDSRGIRFFLFAPTLTLFSSASACTALCCTAAVIYENGASVNTSFLTNLEPKGIRFRSAPKLQAMVQEGVDEFTKTQKKQLPKYHYPPQIIVSTWVGRLSARGIDFSVPVAESEGISGLDSQKASGKAIYGKGYIVSDAVTAEREKAEREKAEREKAEREKAEREKAEREKAEREKAEREKAERWTLSERELAIIERLNKNSIR